MDSTSQPRSTDSLINSQAMHVVYFSALPDNHPAKRPGAIGIAFASPTPWGDLPWIELSQAEYEAALAATILPPPPQPPEQPEENWAGLESELRNSPVWARAFDAASRSVRANAAFTLVLTTLTTTHSLTDLRFGWEQLRACMREQASLSDFGVEELEFVRQALERCNFNPAEFDL